VLLKKCHVKNVPKPSKEKYGFSGEDKITVCIIYEKIIY
jgi:hypothetical protein